MTMFNPTERKQELLGKVFWFGQAMLEYTKSLPDSVRKAQLIALAGVAQDLYRRYFNAYDIDGFHGLTIKHLRTLETVAGLLDVDYPRLVSETMKRNSPAQGTDPWD